MLTSILPGIRDLRAPLASGWIFLIGLWLLLAPTTLTPSKQGRGGYASLYELGQLVGRVGVLAAASFVAYFIGLLLQQLGRLFIARLYGRIAVVVGHEHDAMNLAFAVLTFPIGAHRSVSYSRSVIEGLGIPAAERLHAWLLRPPHFQFREDAGRLLPDASPEERGECESRLVELATERWRGEELVARGLEDFVDSLPGMTHKLRERRQAYFDEYDKMRSEAELREALVPAVLVLTVALCWRWSLWWMLLIIFVGWLLAEGRRLRIEANTVAVEAVMGDAVGLFTYKEDAAREVVRSVEEEWRAAPGRTAT